MDPQNTQPGTEASQTEDRAGTDNSVVVISKADLLATLQKIREFLEGYGVLIDKMTESDEWNREALELVRTHHSMYQNGDSPLAKLHMVAGLFQHMLRRVTQERFKFTIPTRVGLIPEAESEDLDELSQHLKQMNVATEGMVAEVVALAKAEPARSQDKLRSLLLCITSFFKALLRQDWEDVILFMTHINLITTTQESQQLVAQIARIARNIYNSLNEFSDSFSMELLSQSTEEIPDAVQNLQSVITRLEDAANTNLDTLEELSGQLAEHKTWLRDSQDMVGGCEVELERLQAESPALAEDLKSIQAVLRDEIGVNLAELDKRAEENNQTYLAMIANQGFQDLTGQTLRKVIGFIEAMEYKLIELLPNYKQYQKSQTEAVEEQQEPGEQGPGKTMQSQENVDQLLADLGF